VIAQRESHRTESVPAAAPVLAQIPAGAPGRGYWVAIRFLVWLISLSVLFGVYGWFTGDFRDLLEIPTPMRLAILIGFVVSPLPLPLRFGLRKHLMRSFGVPAHVVWRWGHWTVHSDRPLRRRPALFCLLGPPAMLTLLGAAGMALHWPWVMVLVAFDWAAAAPDGALAWRVLSEPGCTQVEFRPDGVVLYGTSRRVPRSTSASLWRTSLVMGAAWMLVVVFVLFGGAVEGLPVALLFGSAVFATIRVQQQRHRALKEQHRRLEQEADEARQMQLSLLPAAPPALEAVQLATLFEAAHEVSGDFYLFPHAPPGALRLVLGDVAGKGLPAALTAALAVGFLRAHAEGAADPAALLQGTGHLLRAARCGRTMVATCAAELEIWPRCLRWCNAGLPPPALLRGGAVTFLPGGGVPLGSLSQATYAGHEAALLPGDLLLFYTDGLVEATSPLGDLFGRDRLAAALGRLPAGCSAAAALHALRAELARFIGETEPYDDITAVALRVG
jgi:serine phosphatase RsbU (regulator of sigma subunit)